MRKHLLLTALLTAGVTLAGTEYVTASPVPQQNTQSASTLSGTVLDENGDPVVGASVVLKDSKQGVTTDANGRFTLRAKPGTQLTFSYVGYTSTTVAAQPGMTVTLQPSENVLNEVVVTALGIKKDKKSLGYAVTELDADELMKNKTANPLNSLSGKIAGVNITQTSGDAGAGAQIILRGGTSLERDNQPLFVVDGVIYDNSTNVVGNSAFDGSTSTSSTQSNRIMDINPDDIESMSVLKGPAASALYGSRAANGAVIITTKKGKDGATEVNFSTKYTTQWATRLPKSQTSYGRGYYSDQYDNGVYTNTKLFTDTYNSWGAAITEGTPVYDNIGNFFEQGGVSDTNLSIAGGTENSKFFLSGSYYNQDGIIPTTGYEKATLRFNGEQKWKIFTFGANVAYSQSNVDKTLTSAGLYNSSGSGTLTSVYRWSPTDDMTHYMNEDGSRYRLLGDLVDVVDERSNPYWILNKSKIEEKTERLTGNFNIKADITPWWWISFRMGVDSYTTDNNKTIEAGGVYKLAWQNGMYSENTYRYRYLSTNLLTNFNKQFGDFDFNLLLGTSTDDTRTWTNYRMAWNFEVPEFYSFDNATSSNRDFSSSRSQKRLVGVFGEFRVDWRNTIFATVTGRNDWTSTLPLNNRSYFYPSVSGSVVFSQFLQDNGILDANSPLTFGKVRASWARVGKDTSAYSLETALWPSQEFLGGYTGVSNYWQSGNAYLKPEITESTEIGLELRFFKNRLRFDYAFYTNNSYNQIMSPRVSNATGYILRSVNAGDVYNKGMELSLGGTPIQTKDWTWETAFNISGNRGTVKNLMEGIEILYVTDVQVGNAKAASFPDGHFMAISGSKWLRDDAGNVVLDSNGMPQQDKTQNYFEIGNREPTFSGGWNNTISYKNFSLDMLWEFRVGGHVYNGTQYAMTLAGTSELSANREHLELSGVNSDGDPVSYTFDADKTYQFNGKETSGRTIIANYYQNYYAIESANFMTKVNSLRLRTLSLSYALPKTLLNKTKVIKNASVIATASNLLLFTNYDGDPEVAASGSGTVGSSSVGIDYCGVPATASFSFGVNLTF